MPELPEVEVTRRGLEPQLAGASSRASRCASRGCAGRCRADVHAPRGTHRRAVQRRGKYLLVDCGDGHLILHLGMSGSLRVLPAGTPARKHDHFDLLLGDSDSARCAIRAASARCCGPARTSTPTRCSLISASSRYARARRRAPAPLTRPHRTGIKQFLMDGRRVVGVGNIYANESLFRAGINPRMRLPEAFPREMRKAVRGDQAHAARGDPRRRLEPARLRRRRRQRRLFPATLLGLRQGGQTVPPLRQQRIARSSRASGLRSTVPSCQK